MENSEIEKSCRAKREMLRNCHLKHIGWKGGKRYWNDDDILLHDRLHYLVKKWNERKGQEESPSVFSRMFKANSKEVSEEEEIQYWIKEKNELAQLIKQAIERWKNEGNQDWAEIEQVNIIA